LLLSSLQTDCFFLGIILFALAVAATTDRFVLLVVPLLPLVAAVFVGAVTVLALSPLADC